ncbi:aspartyl protease [Ancylostoma ceylanicum]|uniref:Aspartyl protease n=2 Tax=Ancylostoma ceylanicum TaxID=53326 RepID=A0A0D6LMQ8_9BILA|nr:aspartyl protease [Ancylostoma ceylanicum]EYC11134.1 hypothetical protein Y032_0052g2240 [Ancylostoma ceylanicum]
MSITQCSIVFDSDSSAYREDASHVASSKTPEMEHLDKRLERAIKAFPECFAKTPMLYLRAQLNGRDVLALVDTGAQASIISNEAVEKCQITNDVDKRFCVFANGVGGTRSSLGRILACDVIVSGINLLCSFDVLPSNVCGIDIIIGLDVLTKNQAMVDIASRTVRFGSLGSASFIQPEEAEKMKPFKETDTITSDN